MVLVELSGTLDFEPALEIQLLGPNCVVVGDTEPAAMFFKLWRIAGSQFKRGKATREDQSIAVEVKLSNRLAGTSLLKYDAAPIEP